MSKIYNGNLSWEIPSETKDEISEHNHNFQLNLLTALKNEQQLLLEKMKKAIDEDNIGTYKNLVQALERVTYLSQREEWVQKWSKYSCENKEYVAVWEQKGSEIRNHRKFEIKGEIELTMKDFIATVSNNWDKISKEEKNRIFELINNKLIK